MNYFQLLNVCKAISRVTMVEQFDQSKISITITRDDFNSLYRDKDFLNYFMGISHDGKFRMSGVWVNVTDI